MTEPTEPPVLTLGPAGHQLTQVILIWAEALAARRAALGRLAWSDAENAARAHDLKRRGAAPPIRAMDPDEARHWEHTPPAEVHTRANDTSELIISVGPLHNSRWGLEARLRSLPGHETSLTTPDGLPIDRLAAHVSCEDTETAHRLANQLLAAGPDRAQLQRLQDFAATASKRAMDALAGHGESWEQRLQRTADTVRDVWPGSLAQDVVTRAGQSPDAPRVPNPAFPALTWRLFELEQRGYAPADVLRCLSAEELSGTNIRNPAAFAEWCVENLADRSPLLNLAEDGANGLSQRPTGSRVDQQPNRTVQPSTRPSTQPSADQPTPVRVAMARLLKQSDLPEELVTKLVACDAWPTLAKRLSTYQQQGFPVVGLLADMPHQRLLGARAPAAYTSTLLDNKTGAINADHSRSSPHTHAWDQQPTPTAKSKASHPLPSPTSAPRHAERQRAEHTTKTPAAQPPTDVEERRTTHDNNTPAAERHGAPAAAALRAQATSTPPNRATDKTTTTARQALNAQPPPHRPPSPTSEKRSRHR